jgi:hypothetical protein
MIAAKARPGPYQMNGGSIERSRSRRGRANTASTLKPGPVCGGYTVVGPLHLTDYVADLSTMAVQYQPGGGWWSWLPNEMEPCSVLADRKCRRFMLRRLLSARAVGLAVSFPAVRASPLADARAACVPRAPEPPSTFHADQRVVRFGLRRPYLTVYALLAVIGVAGARGFLVRHREPAGRPTPRRGCGEFMGDKLYLRCR